MFQKRFALFAFALFVSFAIAGCGGSSTPSVAITASAIIVDATDTVTLTATVTNDQNSAGVTWTVSGGGALSGITTTAATYTAPAATSSAQTVTVTVTSVADTTITGSVTITIPARLAVTTTGANLTGAVGTAYSVQLSASSGISPYKWTLDAKSAALPAGWALSSGGLLTGPAPVNGFTGGTYIFDVTDSGTPTPMTVSQSLTVVITPAPAVTFTGTMPTTGTYNTAYAGSAAATGGIGPLTYTVSAGALAGWMTLNSATGTIIGTPNGVAAYNFTIKAADAFGDSNSQAYTVNIAQATPTLGFAAIPSQTYSASPVTAVASDQSGVVSNGAITYSLTVGSTSAGTVTSGGVVTLTGAGTVYLTAAQAATANYAAPTPATTTITVNKAVATINVTPYTVTYDGNSHTATATATGVGSVNLASELSLTGSTHTNAGSYTTDAWTFTDTTGNYTNQSGTVTDTINKAVATVVVTPYSVVYDGNPHTATGTATGVNSTNLNSELILTGTTHTAAGAYATDSWTFTDTTGNYTNQTGTVNDAIAGAAATVNLGSLAQNYNGTPISATATTVPSGQTVTFTYTGTGGTGYPTSANPPTNAGSYTVVGTISNVNYSGSSSGTLVISPVAATINVTPYTVTYNGSSHSASATATGVSGANLITDVNLNNTTHTNAGTYAGDIWSFTDPNGNYTPVAATTITDTINKATPTLTFTAIGSQTYGNAPFTATASSASTGAITYSVFSGPATIGASTGIVTLNGPNTGTATVVLNATQVADANNNVPTTASTSFKVNSPAALTLTPSLPTANQGQSYTGTVTAAGGIYPYTWMLNGTPITTGSGSVTISNSISAVLNSNGTMLTVSGTPTTTTSVTVNVAIADSEGTPATQTSNNSITVNSAGQNVNGYVSFNNSYTGGTYMPVITLNIYSGSNTTTGTPVQTVYSDNSQGNGTGNGNFSFTAVANGTYTIVPSISGPESLFYPAFRNVTVGNSGVTGSTSFAVSLGYTVTGTASYGGPNTGQLYLNLINSCCSGGGNPGTSISAATLSSSGAFTIRGVPPGTYTLQATIDNLGYGAQNDTNPTASSSSFKVTAGNVTLPLVTLTDPTAYTPATAPTIDSIAPTTSGVIISYESVTDSNGIETPSSYQVQWSTTSSFISTSSISMPATGANGGTVWILNDGTAGITGVSNFDNGPYYFRVRSMTAHGNSAWAVWGSPTAITIGAPTGGNTVTGSVSIPSTITPTGPLYVGYFDQNTGNAYSERIASPSNSVANIFSINVPNGSNYFFFAVLDQNNDGQIDPGDLTDTNDKSAGSVTVSGNETGQTPPALPTANTTATVTTQYDSYTYNNGGSPSTSISYGINFQVEQTIKLPVAVTLMSGPNVINPVDLGNICNSCGHPQFQYNNVLNNDTPAVNDAYTFQVSYLGSSTPETVTGNVTAVLGASQLATSLAPSATTSSSNDLPNFTWTYPANAGNYTYQFWLNGSSLYWSIPGSNSKSNGFNSTDILMPAGIQWPTDPYSGDSGNNRSGTLGSGSYNWALQTQDANGNQATTTKYFIVP